MKTRSEVQKDMLIHSINVEISNQRSIAKTRHTLTGTASRQLGIIKGLKMAKDLIELFEVK